MGLEPLPALRDFHPLDTAHAQRTTTKAPAVTDKTDEKAVRAAEDCCRLIKL